MVSTSETGHAKNVANFENLVSFVASYGAAYKPSKESLTLNALQNQSLSAKNALAAVNTALPAHSNAIAAREAAFEPLSKLITRIMNALKATDTTQQVDESARTLVRKLQGTRATAKLTEEEKKVLEEKGEKVIEVSSSQMSYDSRLENFDKLIQLLSSVPEYAPNEEELKVTSLKALLDTLKAKNSAVTAATAPLSNARIARNVILYKTDTGLVDTALAVKSYIKSLYGATSPQYKQISKLEFKNIKV